MNEIPTMNSCDLEGIVDKERQIIGPAIEEGHLTRGNANSKKDSDSLLCYIFNRYLRLYFGEAPRTRPK